MGLQLKIPKKAWIESSEIRYIQSESRLVILKEKTTQKTIGFIMTMIGDKNYLEEKEFKLQENNNYLKKDHNFSGMVLYHAMDGSFVNGWKFTRGKVTHKVHLSEDSDMGIRLKSIIICTTEYIEGWEIVERDASAGIPGSESYQGTTCEIIYYSIPITVCQDWGFSGGGGGDSSDGEEGGYEFPDAGGGGDSNPPTDEPQPCNCTNTCPVCGGCLDVAFLKSANTYCPACSCAPLVIIDTATFKDTKAECVYNKLVISSMMENLLQDFVGSSQYHVTYKVVPSITGYVEQPYGRIVDNEDGTMTISINAFYFDKVTPVFLAKTILHETLHAYIYQEVAALGGYPNLENSTFENLYAYYQLYGKNDYQHDYISQYYIPQMASTLRAYDGNKYTLDYYTAISWSGLSYTWGWQTMTQAQRDAIVAKTNIINSGDKNCR